MRRMHAFEIEDLAWCPAAVRDGITDCLRWSLDRGDYYSAVLPRLRDALERTGATRIVDLCSGAGGPWPRLIDRLGPANGHLAVRLTDLRPNPGATHRLPEHLAQRIRYVDVPIDAAAVPADLGEFRTIFTGFHHLDRTKARAVLADAVANGHGIGVFEFTQRSIVAVLAMATTPLVVLLAAPFVRPLRWSRLLLTYVVPVIPLAALWDGVVSCLRTYSPAELRQMVSELGATGFDWEIGAIRRWPYPVPITYLIGCPRAAARPNRKTRTRR